MEGLWQSPVGTLMLRDGSSQHLHSFSRRSQFRLAQMMSHHRGEDDCHPKPRAVSQRPERPVGPQSSNPDQDKNDNTEAKRE